MSVGFALSFRKSNAAQVEISDSCSDLKNRTLPKPPSPRDLRQTHPTSYPSRTRTERTLTTARGLLGVKKNRPSSEGAEAPRICASQCDSLRLQMLDWETRNNSGCSNSVAWLVQYYIHFNLKRGSTALSEAVFTFVTRCRFFDVSVKI